MNSNSLKYIINNIECKGRLADLGHFTIDIETKNLDYNSQSISIESTRPFY